LIQLVNSEWDPIDETYRGRKFHVLRDMHRVFPDYVDQVSICDWLKRNEIDYHFFGDDLVLYKPKEATLFVLTWSK